MRCFHDSRRPFVFGSADSLPEGKAVVGLEKAECQAAVPGSQWLSESQPVFFGVGLKFLAFTGI
jgi:hypothetical protein